MLVNLATAFLAASVVHLFEETIEKVVVLASLMPIVAGMGGNAATQTLAVTVRGLALGEVAWENSRRVLLKEFLVGLANGIVNGLVAGLIVCLRFGFSAKAALIGGIIALAMVNNMVIAGIAGTLIPLVLKKLKADYAGKIKFVFHQFPLTRIHQHAAIAAFAAVAAGQQGKFWEMHNLLYESQEAWKETDNFAPILVNFGRQLGLNLEQFESDINSAKVRSIVLTDVQRGESMGVTGTPTLFLNGKLIDSEKLTMGYLREEIDKLLKAKS